MKGNFSNKRLYKKLKYDLEVVRSVFSGMGDPRLVLQSADIPGTDQFTKVVKLFQEYRALKADGVLGSDTLFEIEAMHMQLTPSAKAELFTIYKIMEFESGGTPDKVNADLEFRKLKYHRAYQKSHIGLSLGYIQMTQDGGTLGRYFKYCRDRDKCEFDKIFGEQLADDIIEVTTTPGRSGFSQGILRGPRVKRFTFEHDGEKITKDLWESPLVEKCQAIAIHPKFRILQYDIAISVYLDPMIPLLKEFGAYTVKSVAIAMNLSIHYGPAGAERLFRKHWSKTSSERANLERIAKELTKKRVLGKLKITKSRPQRILDNKDISWEIWRGF